MIAPERSGGASYSETGVSNDPSVRSLYVRPSGKTEQITEDITRNLQRRFEQSIFKVPKKTADLRLRNDLPGP